MKTPKIVIADLDGTIALIDHRRAVLPLSLILEVNGLEDATVKLRG